MLESLAVVDVARGVAGPACAAHLATLGASVLRLPPPGDWLDGLDTGPSSTGRCLRDACNRGKQVEGSLAVVDHAAQVREQALTADVLVCDWNPARSIELGLSLDELRELNPRLVVVAVTPYGLDGPFADRPGSELTAYHAGGEGYLLPGGLVHLAVPERAPVRAGRFLADEDAGLAAALGAVMALLRREVSGAGDLVDVSILEVQLGEGRTTLGRAFFEGLDFDRTYAGYDYAGVLRCRDGWICVRPSEEHHWRSFTEVIGRPDLATDRRFATRNARFENGDALNIELERWTTTVDRSVVRQALLIAGCPGGPYLEPVEVLRDEAINSRDLWEDAPNGGAVPNRLFHVTAASQHSSSALRHRLADATGAGPLNGLRVLDLTWVAAGPYATELLAFAGADVIKIESRTQPDLFRRPLHADGDLDANIRFVDLNQGKRSLCLDLKSEAGREAVLRLAATCDLLVENFRPGVRDRLGLGDAELWNANPAMVVVALSGFGAASKDADRPGYASIFSAESGLSAMTGWTDCPPADVRDTNDLRSGTLGALAAAAGLFSVARGGPATSLDVAARDALVLLQAHVLLQGSRGGTPSRCGNALDEAVPYGVFPTEDGWLALSVRTEQEWTALRTVIPGLPDLGRDMRLERRDEIDRLVSEWTRLQGADHAAAGLCSAGVPAARSAPASALRVDPQLAARRALRPIDHPRLGELLAIGPPIRFASAPPPPRGERPPLLGEHDCEVLLEAGLGQESIQAARSAAGAP